MSVVHCAALSGSKEIIQTILSLAPHLKNAKDSYAALYYFSAAESGSAEALSSFFMDKFNVCG